MRAFPGSGRLYAVVPSGRGSPVSGGTLRIAGLRWHGCDVASLQFRRDIEEHHLPLDLFLDERRDQAKLLNSFDFDSCAALDGDIDILANRPDPSLHLPRRPEQGSEREGDLPSLFRGFDIRRRRDFYE